MQIDKIVKRVWHGGIHSFPVSKLNASPKIFDINGDLSRWYLRSLKILEGKTKRKKIGGRNLNAIDENERNLAAALDFDYPLVSSFTLHFFFFCGPRRRESEHVPGTPIHRAGFFNGPKANKNANPLNQSRFRFPVPGGGLLAFPSCLFLNGSILDKDIVVVRFKRMYEWIENPLLFDFKIPRRRNLRIFKCNMHI